LVRKPYEGALEVGEIRLHRTRSEYPRRERAPGWDYRQ
jgi:hypothetical protein